MVTNGAETPSGPESCTVQSLKADPAYIKHMKPLGFTDSQLEKHLYAFMDACRQWESCEKCRGLEDCPHAVKGTVETVIKDQCGFPERVMMVCRKKADLETVRQNGRKSLLYSSMTAEESRVTTRDIAAGLSQQNTGYRTAFDKCLQNLRSHCGVYLYGQPGCGKTYMMCAVINTLAQKGGAKLAFVNTADLISRVRTIEELSETERLLNMLKKVDLLVLDDIGSEHITAWKRDELLFPILDARMKEKRTTVFTSNLRPDDLSRRYMLDSEDVGGLRFVERIRALAYPIYIPGESRRKCEHV